MRIQGDNIPKPISDFSHCNFSTTCLSIVQTAWHITSIICLLSSDVQYDNTGIQQPNTHPNASSPSSSLSKRHPCLCPNWLREKSVNPINSPTCSFSYPDCLAAAFLLPIIARICCDIHIDFSPYSPKAIVLAPTRELCMQIEEQAKQFMKGDLWIPCTVEPHYSQH